MIITDIAQKTPNFKASPNDKYLEVSSILNSLRDPVNDTASYVITNEHDTRPTSPIVHMEVSGPILAEILETPNPNNGHPKAAVKTHHIDAAFSAERAFATFQDYVRKQTGINVTLKLPTVPPDTHFHSLALLIFFISLDEGNIDTGYAQVHYDENGIALPYDIAMAIGDKNSDAELQTQQLGSLKNLALAIFGHQRFNPFPSETRHILIPGSENQHLEFEYLLSDE